MNQSLTVYRIENYKRVGPWHSPKFKNYVKKSEISEKWNACQSNLPGIWDDFTNLQRSKFIDRTNRNPDRDYFTFLCAFNSLDELKKTFKNMMQAFKECNLKIAVYSTSEYEIGIRTGTQVIFNPMQSKRIGYLDYSEIQ